MATTDRLSRLELLVDEQQKLLEHQGELLESLSSQKKKGSSTAHSDEVEPSQSLCSRLNAASYTKPKKSAANGMHFALMCLLDDVESSWPEQYRWLALFICLLPFCVLFLQLYLLVLLMEAGTSRARVTQRRSSAASRASIALWPSRMASAMTAVYCWTTTLAPPSLPTAPPLAMTTLRITRIQSPVYRTLARAQCTAAALSAACVIRTSIDATT